MGVGERTKFFKNFSTLQEVANYAQMFGSPDECIIINKFGENKDVDSGVSEDIWSFGGDRPKPPTTAELFDIASTDVDDTSAGTGARTVLVQGLDGNYDIQEEYLILNGTTAVRTTNAYININRMLCATTGTSESNEGVITATGVTSTDVMAEIPIGVNITQMSHYMVPRNYMAYVLDLVISSYKADGAGERQSEISLWIQVPSFAEYQTYTFGVNSSTVHIPLPAGIVTREKSLIWLDATAATNNTSVSAQYNLLLINKDWVRNP